MMKATGPRLCDAHAHLGDTREHSDRKNQEVLSLICASTPAEAEHLRRLTATPAYSSCLIPTYGLHPWHAASYRVADMEPYFPLCPVIGEIGMDSVWCEVPLTIQERVFREQLALASRAKKPVILHTKGQEKEIASIIRDYPNTYLVHWYSCPEHLEDYLRLDCYFSIGPDVRWNPAVQKTAATVSENRLLVETDGMGAVRWACGEAARLGACGETTRPGACGETTRPGACGETARPGACGETARPGACGETARPGACGGDPAIRPVPGRSCPETPAESLICTLKTAARLRRCSPAYLADRVCDNFHRFLGF